MIGISKDLLFRSRLGLIWICLSFASLRERFFRNDFEDGTLEFVLCHRLLVAKHPTFEIVWSLGSSNQVVLCVVFSCYNF